MNRILNKRVIPVTIIICICLLPELFQAASASAVFTVTDGVHVREEATTSSKSLTVLIRGTGVDVLEHNPAGWSKVQAGGKTGYIRSDFIKLNIGPAPEVFSVTDGVHLREKETTSSKSLTVLTRGTNVDVLEHNPAGWSRVQTGDKTGFIRSDFLKYTCIADTAQTQVAGGSETGSNETGGGEAPETVLGQTAYMLYTTGNVNLRDKPSTESKIIRTLAKGTGVDLIANEENGWSKVVHNGTDGHIKSDLLTPSPQGEPQIRYTNDVVNLRASDSTSSSIRKTLPKGTAVKILADLASGWSEVTTGDKNGCILSELLSSAQSPQTAGQEPGRIIAVMKVIVPEGANVREGQAATTQKLTSLPYGTSVNVLSNESSGWSRVDINGTKGYIRSDLLGHEAKVELVTMSEIKHLLPVKENIRVVDVRTGISFNIKIYSKGTHADYEPSTRADTDALYSTRNGVRSWSVRPVWVYAGNRVFAAATHGMPHDVDWIKDNGVDGHLCLHFHNTTAENKNYQTDLRNAVQEAYDKRPA